METQGEILDADWAGAIIAQLVHPPLNRLRQLSFLFPHLQLGMHHSLPPTCSVKPTSETLYIICIIWDFKGSSSPTHCCTDQPVIKTSKRVFGAPRQSCCFHHKGILLLFYLISDCLRSIACWWWGMRGGAWWGEAWLGGGQPGWTNHDDGVDEQNYPYLQSLQ